MILKKYFTNTFKFKQKQTNMHSYVLIILYYIKMLLLVSQININKNTELSEFIRKYLQITLQTVVGNVCLNKKLILFIGPPLFIGMDLTIASFDSISEVNMVSFIVLLF